MENKKNQIVMTLFWLIAIFIGCLTLTIFGLGLWQTVSMISDYSTYTGSDLSYQFALPVIIGLLCLSGIGFIVFAVLIIILISKRNKKDPIKPIKPLEPTGASADDPIPPTG